MSVACPDAPATLLWLVAWFGNLDIFSAGTLCWNSGEVGSC